MERACLDLVKANNCKVLELAPDELDVTGAEQVACDLEPCSWVPLLISLWKPGSLASRGHHEVQPRAGEAALPAAAGSQGMSLRMRRAAWIAGGTIR